jgi:hypothetical protein
MPGGAIGARSLAVPMPVLPLYDWFSASSHANISPDAAAL